MEIIDVTLRDGGHAVQFNWPIDFAIEYYEMISEFEQINWIELGYWKQSYKSENFFYNLDIDKVKLITKNKGLKKAAIMIDFHYCTHDLNQYPTAEDQNEIGLIRLCSRKEDIDKALIFGEKLKAYTNLKISFNIFNTSNYTSHELYAFTEKAIKCNFNYIYFADTHGSLYLKEDFIRFKESIDLINKNNIKSGVHLHNHSGKAFSNYEYISTNNVCSSDTSIRGLGKGSGNLSLEYIIDNTYLPKLASFILKYNELLTLKLNPYELITSKHSITDNYAKQASELKLDLENFDIFAGKLGGVNRDSFDEKLLLNYLK